MRRSFLAKCPDLEVKALISSCMEDIYSMGLLDFFMVFTSLHIVYTHAR